MVSVVSEVVSGLVLNRMICMMVLLVVLVVKLMMLGEFSGLCEIDWKIVLVMFSVVLIR